MAENSAKNKGTWMGYRVHGDDKKTIARAAKLAGETLTDFVLSSALRRAKRVLRVKQSAPAKTSV